MWKLALFSTASLAAAADEASSSTAPAPTASAAPVTKAPLASTTSPPPKCADVEDWLDATGDGCEAYEKEKWCTPTGDYGSGWGRNIGTFEEYTYRGLTAPKACCACGGGVKPGQADPPAMAEEPAHTLNGCECKKSWALGDLKCDSFCCNPDNDVGGAWCVVAAEFCEEADWGYCLDPDHDGDFVDANDDFGLFGFYDYYYSYYGSDNYDSSGLWDDEGEDQPCVDRKNTDGMAFSDEDGYFCNDYETYTWCTRWGRPDWGWHEEWGTLEAAAKKNMLSAPQACCTCGGGNRSAEAVAAAKKSLTAAAAPEGSWPSGPLYFAVPAVLVAGAGLVGWFCGRRKDTGLGDGIPTKLGRAGEA